MKATNDLALKEWAVVIKAMLKGRQILLLRKGGIEEDAFQLRSDEFWLFPTYEHQSLHRIRPEFHDWLTEKEQAHQHSKVTLEAYGVVSTAFRVPHADALQALTDEHIYNEEHIQQRLRYKPELPLYVLAVRIYRAPTPHVIDYHPDYAGCRSWVPLKQALPTDEAVAVLSDEAFAGKLQRLKTALVLY